MADNLVQSALAKVRETASQILKPAMQATQDTRGFVQQGRFTPVQGFQQLVAPAVQRIEATIPGGFTGAQQRLQQAVQGQPVQLKSLQTGQVQPVQMPKLFDVGQQLQGFGQTVTKPVTTFTQGLQIKPPTLPPISQIPILEGFRPERVKQQIDVLNFTRSQGVDPIFLGTKPGAQGIFPQIGQQIEQTVSGFIGKAPLPFAKPVGKVAGSLVAGLVSESPEVTAVREKLMKQQPLTEQEKNIANESITQYYLGLANPIKGVSLTQKSESILAKGFNNPQRIEEAVIAEAKPIEQRLLSQGIEKDLARTQAQNEARQLVTSRVEQLKAPTEAITPSITPERTVVNTSIKNTVDNILSKGIARGERGGQFGISNEGLKQGVLPTYKDQATKVAEELIAENLLKTGIKKPVANQEAKLSAKKLVDDLLQKYEISFEGKAVYKPSSVQAKTAYKTERFGEGIIDNKRYTTDGFILELDSKTMLPGKKETIKIADNASKILQKRVSEKNLNKLDISQLWSLEEQPFRGRRQLFTTLKNADYEIAVPKDSLDYFLSKYPKAELFSSGSTSPVHVKLGNKTVGLITPIQNINKLRETSNIINDYTVSYRTPTTPTSEIPQAPAQAVTPTAPQNLLEEARKYKTPEEFINARLQEEKYLPPDITKFTGDLNRQAIEDWYKSQTGSWENKKIYHGTSEANKINIENLGFNTPADKSLYFATNKDITKNYGQNVIDLRKNDFNLLDLRSEEGIELAKKYKVNLEYGDTGSSNTEFKNKVKSLGFDGIEYKTDRSNSDIEIYNIEKANQLLKAKTKQQLTDIWNQAQQAKVAPAQAVTPPITPAQVTPPAVISPEPVIGKPPVISPEVPPEVAKVVSKPKVQAKLTIQPKNIDKVIQEGNAQIGRFVEPEKPMRQVLSDSYTMFVDRYNPIVKQAQKAKAFLTKEGAVLRPEFDPEYLVRRLTGAGGIADARFNQELKPIFDQIDSAGIPKIDMDTYLANKRIAGFQKAGRTIYGADPEKAGSIVAALEQKYGQKIKDIANNFYAYQNVGLKELVDSGFLSKDAENILKQANPDYAPLYRVMDQMDEYLGVPSNKTMQGISPIQKIKGSTRLIESPTESIIANTFKQRAAIEKNNVARAIVGLQNVMDMGFQKVAKASPETITVWNDGKKEFWKVGTEIAETAKSLNEDNVNTFLQILSYPASILRQGATGRNIEFMIPNVVRDQLDAAITSKYGYVPFVDYTRGLWEVLKNDLNTKFGLSLDDSVYQSWANSGANIDLGQFSGKKSIQQYFDEKTAKRSLMDWISSGLDALGRYSEQPTRIGLYKKALERTGNPLLAMMESRDATIDFARMGTKMKTANSVIPFLNVGVQGFDKLVRAVKNDPVKLAWNMTKYAAIPAGTITAYNLLNHKEEYAEIPQYVKDSNFVLVKGRNSKGTVDYITIPKGNIVPLVANPIESFMSYLANVDGRSFNELATTLITQTLPIVGDAGNIKESAIKTVGGVIPQAIKPITENLLNVSFYKYNEKKDEAKKIVPDYLLKKPAYQQAYDWTPNLYKSIGAVLNVSPLQVQNLMEGYLAGYTKLPAQIVDGLIKISKGESVAPKETPILRRFINETLPVQEQKPVYTPPTPSLMERITGKVGATEKIPEETDVEVIKQKLDYNPKLATPNELATYYGRDITYGQTGYKKAIEDKTFYSRLSDIESRDTLTPEQKTQAIDLMLQKNNVSRADYEYYKVAKQDTNTKTLYAQEQIANIIRSGGSDQQVFDWLANNKLDVRGQQIVTSGVLTNLVNDGVISKNQSDAVKKLDVTGTTTNPIVSTKTKKLRARKPKKVAFKKVALKKVKMPKLKAIKVQQIKPIRFAKLKTPTTSRTVKLKTIKVRG